MFNKDPLVSIIMPTYNYGRFIGEALRSLLAQTYQNWECIIVDDGSKDNTKEVVESFSQNDSRFKYIFQENMGVSAARNTALKSCQGKYIQLLDSDDMLKPAKLALHVELLEKYSNIDLVYSDTLLFDDSESSSRNLRFFRLPGATAVSGKDEIIIDNLFFDNIFLTPSVIFRRKVYEKAGLFIKGLHGLEDWNYWYRVALLGFEFHHDARVDAYGIIRGHATSSATFHDRMLLGRIEARKSIISFIQNLRSQNNLSLKPLYVSKLIMLHNALLNKDLVKYSIYFKNEFFKGLKYIVLHAYYSKRPYFAFYDGAYWWKERLKIAFGNSH